MMAKMFYTMDETKAALGKGEEDIKQFAREGRLREFRDGPRLMFKADQVEALKAEMGGGGDAVNLGPSDTGAGLGLVDTGRSGSGLTLMDSGASRGGIGSPGAVNPKEETAFADIGLSGTIGGVPSPGRIQPGPGSGITSLSGSGLSGSGVGSPGGTKGGINVFEADEGHQHADPSAQTAIGSGIQDQVQLESIGSGSGLLDLTRESDDTSLGAVFDELSPGPQRGATGSAAPAVLESVAGGSAMGMAGFEAPPPMRMGGPVIVEAADASAPAFAWMALAGLLIVCFGGFVIAASVMGLKAQIIEDIHKSLSTYIMGAFGAVIVFGVVGFIIGKATTK